MANPDETRSPAGRRGRTGARREEILAHATRLFAEEGVGAVGTRRIAQAVGISQPSVYAHFPTKQALVEAVCVRAFEALSAQMLETLRAVEGPAVLEALARAYVDFALAEPEAYRIALMNEGAYDPADGRPNAAMAAGGVAFKLYRAAIVRELGAGLSEPDQDMLAQSIWASLHGLVALLIARPTFDWCDRQRLIDFHIARLHPA